MPLAEAQTRFGGGGRLESAVRRSRPLAGYFISALLCGLEPRCFDAARFDVISAARISRGSDEGSGHCPGQGDGSCRACPDEREASPRSECVLLWCI